MAWGRDTYQSIIAKNAHFLFVHNFWCVPQHSHPLAQRDEFGISETRIGGGGGDRSLDSSCLPLKHVTATIFFYPRKGSIAEDSGK